MKAEFCFIEKTLSIDGVNYDLVKTYFDNCFVFVHPTQFGTMYLAKLSHTDRSINKSKLTLICFQQCLTIIGDYELDTRSTLILENENGTT